jgi:hypothetical protein
VKKVAFSFYSLNNYELPNNGPFISIRNFGGKFEFFHTGDDEYSCLLGGDGLSSGKNFLGVSKQRNVKNSTRDA